MSSLPELSRCEAQPQTALKPHRDTWRSSKSSIVPQRTVIAFCVTWLQQMLNQQHLVSQEAETSVDVGLLILIALPSLNTQYSYNVNIRTDQI